MILGKLVLRLAVLALSLPLAAFELRAQAPAADVHVVVLATAASTTKQPAGALPEALRGRAVYWREVKSADTVRYEYCLGFFATRAEAQAAQKQLVASFRGARVATVGARERERFESSRPRPAPVAATAAATPANLVPGARMPTTQSVAVAAALDATKPQPTPAATQAPATAAPVLAATQPAQAQTAPPPLPKGAEPLMAAGRAAITREDYAGAIRAFTQLLALPENELSRDALEFLALSYERRGDAARARSEYENYLKRYPEGEDSDRVRQRLSMLRPAPRVQPLLAPAQTPDGSRTFAFGSLSQFYYRGNSKIDSIPVTANTFDRTTLSVTDQSTLVTNLDLSARFIDNTYDHRVVFRDTNTQNYVSGQPDVNRLNAAYYDFRYKPADASIRLGRQPGYSGGVLGRFDGATLGYGITPRVRVNVVGGEPVMQATNFESKQRFFGVNTELGPFSDRWSGNLYLLRQTVDGIADREVTGAEARYWAPQGSVFSLVEYDTLFRHTNVATLQGNWITDSKTAFNFMADYRMTPALQTATATVGEQTSSIRTLLNTYSEDELRQRARALTARMAMASAGMTTPVSRAWQLGADLRVSRISHTDGTNNVPGSPGSGYVYVLTGQAIGAGLYAARDVSVFAVSRISADAYDGLALRANSRVPLDEFWVLDGSLLWYKQNNQNASSFDRIAPTLRLGYKWRRSVTLEAELGLEATNSRGPSLEEKVNRNFFSVGYRWDF